jgi:hypothetical protein
MRSGSSHRKPGERRITERDLDILGEVLRWGQLTTRQIARWFFDHPKTATNRVTVLLSLGYLRTIPIPWHAPAIVTATAKGARARADLQLPPKLHAPGRLVHDLTVVEIAAWLLDQDPQATWITERELLRDQLREVRDRDGRLRGGPGRRPDGVLIRRNNQREAVEVELTPKRSRTEYDRKLEWYLGQAEYRRVQWFVPSASLRERLNRLSHDLRLTNSISVTPLPAGLEYLPGIKPDRRPSGPVTMMHDPRRERETATVRMQRSAGR